MTRWITAEVRQVVAARANFLCEYCLIGDADSFYGCEVDHIISLKHGGPSDAANLAYACAVCNRTKGSDIGSISAMHDFIRFFNPRLDRWAEHFVLEQPVIQALTDVGEVTARILQFNTRVRLHEREEMIRFGKYPNEAALAIMRRE